MVLNPTPYTNIYYCPTCRVQFLLSIEPITTIPRHKFPKEYPRSIKWLKDLSHCPVCQNPLSRE